MNETPHSPEFEAILDECLDALLRGTVTLDECLEHYPDYATDLKPLLQTGLLTSRLKSPEMPAARIDALEDRLRGQMPNLRSAQSRVVQGQFSSLAKLVAMIAVVLFFALGAGGSVVAASSNSLPGDPLYGLKRLWEQIVLLLVPLTGELDDLWLRLAQTRLYEAEQLAARGELTDAALVDLYESMVQSIALADEQTLPQVEAYLDEVEQTLITIAPSPETMTQYLQVLALSSGTTPQVHTEPSDQELQGVPPTLDQFGLTATLTPVLTDTPAATLTPTFTPSVTSTSTPRVPPTATRTPTQTLTVTPTFTPSITPSATWTPLPLPTLNTGGDTQPTRDPSSGGVQPTSTRILPTVDATIRYRETEQSVFMTQTAQPPPTATGAP